MNNALCRRRGHDRTTTISMRQLPQFALKMQARRNKKLTLLQNYEIMAERITSRIMKRFVLFVRLFIYEYLEFVLVFFPSSSFGFFFGENKHFVIFYIFACGWRAKKLWLTVTMREQKTCIHALFWFATLFVSECNE